MAQNIITYPHFDVKADPNKVEIEFLQILHDIKSDWKDEDVIFKRSPMAISAGLLNTMVKCYNINEPKDAIMIRIVNARFHELGPDRSTEIVCIKELYKRNCAPRILATFKNGFCYEYIHGEVLSYLKLNEEPIWRGIVKDFAKFHSANIESDLLNKSKAHIDDSISNVWQAYPAELANPISNERFKREFPPKEELKAELDVLFRHAISFNSPIVLCHNDSRAENILWNAENQTIHFVDFEAMKYHYQARELASHLQRFCGLTPPDYSLMPSEEFQMKWLRVYLEYYYKYTGRKPEDVTDLAVRKLYVQVAKFHLFCLYYNFIGGPIFEAMNVIMSDTKVNILDYSLANLKEYRRDKQRLMSLEMP